MKMKRRQVRDFGQGVEANRLFQMLIDIGEYPMHPAFVFRPAIDRSHVARNVKMTGPRPFAAKLPPAGVGPSQLTC